MIPVMDCHDILVAGKPRASGDDPTRIPSFHTEKE